MLIRRRASLSLSLYCAVPPNALYCASPSYVKSHLLSYIRTFNLATENKIIFLDCLRTCGNWKLYVSPLVESLTSSCLVKAYLYRSADTAEVHVDGTHFSELQWGATFTIHHAAEVFSLLSTSHPFPLSSSPLIRPRLVTYVLNIHSWGFTRPSTKAVRVGEGSRRARA